MKVDLRISGGTIFDPECGIHGRHNDALDFHDVVALDEVVIGVGRQRKLWLQAAVTCIIPSTFR
jgi:hypothetical protein